MHTYFNMGSDMSKPVFDVFYFQRVSYCLFQMKLKFAVCVWEGEIFFHGEDGWGVLIVYTFGNL